MNGLNYILMIHMMEHVELAEKLGVNKTYIDSRSAGRTSMPPEYNDSLVDIFNIPFYYYNKELNREDMIYILDHTKNCGVITGLEYILKMSDMQNKEFAGILGIHKQTANLWKKRKQGIPEKYLQAISEILGGIPQGYLQKELNLKDLKDILEYVDIKENAVIKEKVIYNKEAKAIYNKEIKESIINKITISISSDILVKLKKLSQEESNTIKEQIVNIVSDYFSGNSSVIEEKDDKDDKDDKSKLLIEELIYLRKYKEKADKLIKRHNNKVWME